MALRPPLDLPPLPAPRARAMLVLWNPDATVSELSAVVEGDPALTAAVLRAANAAASSPRTPVVTAQEAVVRIGFAAVQKLLAGAVLSSQFVRIEDSWLRTGELWRHLITVGLLAEAGASNPTERRIAFTAGLLHDIGRLAIAAQSPLRYRQVVELVMTGVDPLEAERTVLGLTHTSWGARICELWGLPEPIAEVAASHHDAVDGLAALVRSARETADSVGVGDGFSDPPDVSPDQHGGALDGTALEPDALLAAVGGQEALVTRVEWYRAAFAPR